MRKLLAAALVIFMLCSPALAQDPPQTLWGYVSAHASIVSGTMIVDSGRSDFASVRFVDDFAIGSGVRGVARVDLFSRSRDAGSVGIPTGVGDLQAYSDGEVWLSAYRDVRPSVAVECAAGFMFPMTGLSGSVGKPLDGTKAALACGPRLHSGDGNVSVLVGHLGPVADGDRILGPVPSVLIHAYVPLPFMGVGFALVPDIYLGAAPPGPTDPDGRRQIVRSVRLAIAKRFSR